MLRSRDCLCCRLHSRYRELAPHLVPLDYTNNPDITVPSSLIVTMPELKVRSDQRQEALESLPVY